MFIGAMLCCFGSMLKSSKLFWCGIYLIHEMTSETYDAYMTWYERRQPILHLSIKQYYRVTKPT